MLSDKKRRMENKQFQVTACCGNMLDVLKLFCCSVYMQGQQDKNKNCVSWHEMLNSKRHEVAGLGTKQHISKASCLFSGDFLFQGAFGISPPVMKLKDVIYCTVLFFSPLQWILLFSDLSADDTADNFVRFILFHPPLVTPAHLLTAATQEGH